MMEKPETTIARRASPQESPSSLTKIALPLTDSLHKPPSSYTKIALSLTGSRKSLEALKSWNPAFRDAGVPDNKIKLLIGKALLEIAAGQTDAKSLRGGKRSGERRREIASNGWQALAGPCGDEIKRENPSFKPYTIARLMLKKGPSGLPGERTLAKFLAKRYAADSDWG